MNILLWKAVINNATSFHPACFLVWNSRGTRPVSIRGNASRRNLEWSRENIERCSIKPSTTALKKRLKRSNRMEIRLTKSYNLLRPREYRSWNDTILQMLSSARSIIHASFYLKKEKEMFSRWEKFSNLSIQFEEESSSNLSFQLFKLNNTILILDTKSIKIKSSKNTFSSYTWRKISTLINRIEISDGRSKIGKFRAEMVIHRRGWRRWGRLERVTAARITGRSGPRGWGREGTYSSGW